LSPFLRKLRRFLAKGPRYHWTYGRWRGRRWRESGGVPTPDDATFFSQLKPSLENLRRQAREGDLEGARARLRDHVRLRQEPVTFFHEADRPTIVASVPEPVRRATLAAADEVRQRRFRFRRVAVNFEGAIDWNHRPGGNTDWAWDLNRHSFFHTLGRAYAYSGDEAYAETFRDLLLDWLEKNPENVRAPAWSSVFEVAFRINTWSWAFAYFRQAAAFDPETCTRFLKGLQAHAQHVDRHMELHANNNHLLLEAKALAVAGILFPEFQAAARWRERGTDLFISEVRKQVTADGVHGERAILYHRIISGQLLEFLTLLEAQGEDPPGDLKRTFEHMLEFEVWLKKADGTYPLLGDSSSEDTYLNIDSTDAGLVFAGRPEWKGEDYHTNETTFWLLGAERLEPFLGSTTPPSSPGSRAFTEGGYVVLRSGAPEHHHFAFDCGPFCYPPLPNHGHADALSFDLTAHGEPFLVDPGMYSAHLGTDWRNYFRGTRAHNTVQVDGCDQTVLFGVSQVGRQARCVLHEASFLEHIDFLDGSHDGYTRLDHPVRHRRKIIFVKAGYWVIVDLLEGTGAHTYESNFHFYPGVEAKLDPVSHRVDAVSDGTRGPKRRLEIVPVNSGPEGTTVPGLQSKALHGNTSPIGGWVALHSGEKQAVTTIVHERHGEGPVAFTTVLFPHAITDEADVEVSAVGVLLGGTPPATELDVTCLRISCQTFTDLVVLDHHGGGRVKAFSKHETDARFLHLRYLAGSESPEIITLRGGQRLQLPDGTSISSRELGPEGPSQKGPLSGTLTDIVFDEA